MVRLQRRGEVLGLRWSEVDLPRRTTRLADTNNRFTALPPVGTRSMVIQSQPRVGDVVFASRSGGTPIVGYRKMWLRIAALGVSPPILAETSRPSPACSATRRTASPAGTSIPPMRERLIAIATEVAVERSEIAN
jgi:integrase